MQIITKMEPIKYVKFGDIEVTCSEFIDTMEDLEDTDFMVREVIYNQEFADYLEKIGLITSNAKGSYCKTDKFDEEWPKIRGQYYEALENC